MGRRPGLPLFWDIFCQERLKNREKSRIIMSAEQTVNRFIPAASAEQFHKNGSEGLFYGVQTVLQYEVPLERKAFQWKVQEFWGVLPETFALEQSQFA